MRKLWDLMGYDPQLTLAAVSWLGICYVVYQDIKGQLELWAIALACITVGYFGFFIITKAVRPYFLWSDRKLRSWRRVR